MRSSIGIAPISAAYLLLLTSNVCDSFTLNIGNHHFQQYTSIPHSSKGVRVGIISKNGSYSSVSSKSARTSLSLSSSTIINGDTTISSSATVTSTPSTSSSTDKASSHENFDYLSHWYPVSWARDLQIDRPTKITIFDVDYVVAKVIQTQTSTDNNNVQEVEEVIAMVDVCPHKSAALSEGRVTKCGKSFQCAYHGWTFDSKTGECIDIPQVAPAQVQDVDVNSDVDTKEDVEIRSKRRNGTDIKSNGIAVPAMISQGMVWLFPGGGLEEALLAPPPPIVPELEKDGYRMLIQAIRDFPIDWTVLIENIMDPDHGLFAHQTEAFDLYSASKSNPVTLEEEVTNNGKGWTVTSRVDATYELLRRNEEQELMMTEKKKKKKKIKFSKNKKEGEQVLKSTTTFVAPNLIYMGRRDENDETGSMTVFFVTPTGTGKSRFMSCLVGKPPKWLHIPRFFAHMSLNNFLDQDTFLLATQQRHVLATESQLSLEINNDDDISSTMNIPVRRNLYKYRSPSEKLGSRVGNWLDSTLSRVPNRLQSVRAYGGYKPTLEKLSMTRREVLDRYTQHTAICKDSMGVVKKCQRLRKYMKMMALFPFFVRAMMFGVTASSTTKSFFQSTLFKVNRSLTPSWIVAIWTVSAMTTYLAKKLEKEFKFKYTEEHRDNDMDKVPSVWLDRL